MIETTIQEKPTLEINASRQFTSWLYEQNTSLAFTTYQAGKLLFIGLQADGKLSVFERTFNRCMGLHSHGNDLYMTSLYQLWRFNNTLEAGQSHRDYDAVYIPQLSYVTGDIDIHDIVTSDSPYQMPNSSASSLPAQNRFLLIPYLVVWQPLVKPIVFCLSETSFISKLAAEDRCHLNGLALRDGQPKYVTSVSQSDVAEGWREHRSLGGCVIDVESNEVLLNGLSMPHSPRWHQDKLWLLNSGTGEIGYIDLDRERFEPVAFCPGYLRGFAIHNDFAIVGISQPRHNKTFSGLVLDERLQEKNAEPRCGLLVIDLRSGDTVHSLRVDGVIQELYDVVTLPGIRRPMAIGLRTDEIRRVVTVE